jgi:hypothetical protein
LCCVSRRPDCNNRRMEQIIDRQTAHADRDRETESDTSESDKARFTSHHIMSSIHKRQTLTQTMMIMMMMMMVLMGNDE